MPVKVGGKLRSPRAHAAAATQEICDCWEVEWHSIRLLVLPLADGTTSSDGFELSSSDCTVTRHRLPKVRAASGASLVPLDLHASRRGAARVLPLRFAAGRGAPPPRRGSRILFRAFNSRVGSKTTHAAPKPARENAAGFLFCFPLTPPSHAAAGAAPRCAASPACRAKPTPTTAASWSQLAPSGSCRSSCRERVSPGMLQARNNGMPPPCQPPPLIRACCSELGSFLCHGDGSRYRLKCVCRAPLSSRAAVHVFAEWPTCSWGGTAASDAFAARWLRTPFTRQSKDNRG